MTNFQGEEKLAYHGEDYFSSTPVSASLGRRGEDKMVFKGGKHSNWEQFRICGLCDFFPEEKAV